MSCWHALRHRTWHVACLHQLNLACARAQITDAGLAPLARGLTNLRSLDLSGCVAVTERGLAALAACLGALQTLKLGGTSRCAFLVCATLRLKPECRDLP